MICTTPWAAGRSRHQDERHERAGRETRHDPRQGTLLQRTGQIILYPRYTLPAFREL
jgi:hypothetical protein